MNFDYVYIDDTIMGGRFKDKEYKTKSLYSKEYKIFVDKYGILTIKDSFDNTITKEISDTIRIYRFDKEGNLEEYKIMIIKNSIMWIEIL